MTVSVFQAALGCRCPACGKGALFRGWTPAGALSVRDRCKICGLDLHEHDSGDGPASLVMFPLGAILVGLALWVEFRFNPPIWVHFVLWPIVGIILAVAMMRPLKAALIAVQYRHRAREMGL